jgi:hypothetical protein
LQQLGLFWLSSFQSCLVFWCRGGNEQVCLYILLLHSKQELSAEFQLITSYLFRILSTGQMLARRGCRQTNRIIRLDFARMACTYGMRSRESVNSKALKSATFEKCMYLTTSFNTVNSYRSTKPLHHLGSALNFPRVDIEPVGDPSETRSGAIP